MRDAPLPPSPMTDPSERPRDMPLPWSTPLATLVAAAACAPVMALWLRLTAQQGQEPRAWWEVPLILAWCGLTTGLGAAVMDHAAQRLSAPVRWGLGMAGAALLPSPALVLVARIEVGTGPWAVVAFTVVAAIGSGLLGLTLGFVRRQPGGLLWKLPASGALVAGGAPLVLVAAGAAVQTAAGGAGPVPWGHVLFGASGPCLVLALFGGAVGLAVAERLRRAVRASGNGFVAPRLDPVSGR